MKMNMTAPVEFELTYHDFSQAYRQPQHTVRIDILILVSVFHIKEKN